MVIDSRRIENVRGGREREEGKKRRKKKIKRKERTKDP